MIPCRQLGWDPAMVIGAAHHIGRQPSATGRERRAAFASFRRHARKNGCTAAQLISWMARQDMTWLQGVKLVQKVLGYTRGRAQNTLSNAGWTPSPVTQNVNKGLSIERR